MAESSNTGKRSRNAGSFKKGDSRINRNGQISKKRLEFNRTLKELLVSEGELLQTGTIGEKTVKLKKIEWLMKSVWKKAIEGESWAVNFIADRVEGRAMQPLEHSGELAVTLKKVLTDERPGE